MWNLVTVTRGALDLLTDLVWMVDGAFAAYAAA